ncbi:YdeI/OmpD-associated family protein [Pontibacter vulgaris]|uniref:YdeI/OmpD-associated family protein n=1 Tax=Pontibacter vulgaris TaxID=2905679 RepID=UPI001FA79AF0|nr:YdeI/OmpD-associated family protein [Pontibacter vulgaris]
MLPTFFPTQNDFRKWLEENHEKETELLVGFYKVGSGKPSITWPQSVDEALCFGWIDGVRRNIDAESYSIRFTPRKPKSTWSAVNIKKVEELSKLGLMRPAGFASFDKLEESNSRIYSYEKAPEALSKAYTEQFKANSNAWAFFQGQAPSYKKRAIHWVMAGKQEKTQLSRLHKLIATSQAGNRI